VWRLRLRSPEGSALSRQVRGPHPIAIALRRQDDVALVTKKETLVRRGKKWFRYDAPDKRLFKQLQKTLRLR
jgi:hypothetical protein